MNAMNLISETNGAKQFDDLMETEEGNQNLANQDILIDIGQYTIAWLLDEGESEQEFCQMC